jgi:hypothetical protein
VDHRRFTGLDHDAAREEQHPGDTGAKGRAHYISEQICPLK